MGVAGIVGTRDMNDVLIAGNTISQIGHAGVEYAYESAAIKLHGLTDSIVKENSINDIHHAAGIWLDYNCGNSRVTGNHIHQVMTLLGGVYIEANREPIWVDGNLIYDVEDVPGNEPPKDDFYGGNGISVDISDNCVVAHNTLFRIRGYAAIAIHLAQKERKIMNKSTAMARGNQIINNLIFHTERVIHLDRPHLTTVNGNIYARSRPRPVMNIQDHDRTAAVLWQDWQEYYQHDLNGGYFINGPLTSHLRWNHQHQPLALPEQWQGWLDYPVPGSLNASAWQQATDTTQEGLILPAIKTVTTEHSP